MRVGAILLLALALAGPDDAGASADRAATLAAEMRCLVCQNQSIAESNAPLAVDLRREIEAQVTLGKSDDEIRSFVVARYGEFVLYRPPLGWATAFLWFGPLIMLLGGFWALRRVLR